MTAEFISFSGYAIIGLTLLILAATIAVYLLRLPVKSNSTWYLIGFFICIALSGVAMILANAFLQGTRFFNPWQDILVLAGGVSLSQFAYAYPFDQRSREAKVVLLGLSGITLLAFGYGVYFDYQFLFQWYPELDVNYSFYLLLPICTALVVAIFWRRSVYFSRLAAAKGSQDRSWQHWLHPQSREALALRNFGLALTLAFLPGLQMLIQLPFPYGFVLSNLGAVLALTAITLVYFNHAPEQYSFMAKLVGLTLATVLLIFSIFGSIDYYRNQGMTDQINREIVRRVYRALTEPGDLLIEEPIVGYVVSWNESEPEEPAAYEVIFQNVQAAGFDLQKLIAENAQGYLQELGWPIANPLAGRTQTAWYFMPRYRSYSWRSGQLLYDAYIFTAEGTVYEIGLSHAARSNNLGQVAGRWMGLIVFSSIVVVLVFPVFFRNTLINPLAALLAGVSRVNAGELETAVPIQFNDEIGYLTRSFNNLTETLLRSQARQQALIQELRKSQEELEERVAVRTRELSAFTDLTMLSGEQTTLFDMLQPALSHIMEVGLCQALCVHLLAEDRDSLEMVAYRFLPKTAVTTLASIPLPAPDFARLKAVHEPILVTHDTNIQPHLPPEFLIPPHQFYLGCPLVVGDQTLGWLSCYRQTERPFNLGEMSLLLALARQLGVLVENQRLHERIQQVATFEERKRLGRDLHDSVTQLLYSMTLFTRSCQEAVEDGDTNRLEINLARLADTSWQALREMRFMLFELHPPLIKDLGLIAALKKRFNIVERRLGTHVLLETDGYSSRSAEIENELYYVAIEALNNALKHAAAEHIHLRLWCENGTVCLVIADDGSGFDVAQSSPGLGLPNISQRVKRMRGDLQIESNPISGTKIMVMIPFADGKHRSTQRGKVEFYE